MLEELKELSGKNRSLITNLGGREREKRERRGREREGERERKRDGVIK